MNPIFEQGSGQGIGHSVESFVERFESVCHDHLTNKRAKAFAFIFYGDKQDKTPQILKNIGAFAKLDRISGDKLTIFYLDTFKQRIVERFNREFTRKLGVADTAKPPCIVFFKVREDNIHDTTIVPLENADLVHGLDELLEICEKYIGNDINRTNLRFFTYIKGPTQFIFDRNCANCNPRGSRQVFFVKLRFSRFFIPIFDLLPFFFR